MIVDFGKDSDKNAFCNAEVTKIVIIFALIYYKKAFGAH